MEQLLVSKNAFESYVNYFKDDINKTIASLFNDDFVFFTEGKKMSFVFLDKMALVLVTQNKTIVDIAIISYDRFISDSLVSDIMKSSHLPPRLSRYKELGILRLRAEIIDNFQMGNFIVDKKGLILWTDYNLKFKLNKSLELVTI